MSSSWYQISYTIHPDQVDLYAALLVDISGSGVCTENREVDTFDVDDIAPLAMVTVSGFFPTSQPVESYLQQITSRLHQAGLDTTVAPVVTPVGEEDWADGWKKHFKPLVIGSRLLITPSWLPSGQMPQRHELIIDPGMAFGTGGHETTRLCLEAVEEVMNTIPAPRVLDVGTGSGILAIAAVLLGAPAVEAIDIDPQAVIVAAENAALNAVAAHINCSTTPLTAVTGQYELVLANILAEELVRLSQPLVERVAPGGFLVLSGILQEREAFVREGFATTCLTLVSATHDGEWCCLLYSRTDERQD